MCLFKHLLKLQQTHIQDKDILIFHVYFRYDFSGYLNQLLHIHIANNDISPLHNYYLLHSYFQQFSSDDLLELQHAHIESMDISLLHVFSDSLLSWQNIHIENKVIFTLSCFFFNMSFQIPCYCCIIFA